MAYHTDCKFIRVSGFPLMRQYIGEGSCMVRELFILALENRLSIVFMIEIDSIVSVGGKNGLGGGRCCSPATLVSTHLTYSRLRLSELRRVPTTPSTRSLNRLLRNSRRQMCPMRAYRGYIVAERLINVQLD